MHQQFYNTTLAAQQLGITQPAVSYAIKRGDIVPQQRVGSVYLITPAEIERYRTKRQQREQKQFQVAAGA